MEVKDQIEFADVAEVLVQYLNEALHELKHNQLILVLINDGDKVQTGISLVDDFVLFVVEEIAHLGVSGDYQLVDLTYY